MDMARPQLDYVPIRPSGVGRTGRRQRTDARPSQVQYRYAFYTLPPNTILLRQMIVARIQRSVTHGVCCIHDTPLHRIVNVFRYSEDDVRSSPLVGVHVRV